MKKRTVEGESYPFASDERAGMETRGAYPFADSAMDVQERGFVEAKQQPMARGSVSASYPFMEGEGASSHPRPWEC